jgi:hypothetical protein
VQSEVGQGMADSDARAASAGGGHSGPFVCGGEMWGSDPSWPPWHLHLDRPSSPIHRPCAPGSCRLLDGEAPRQVRWPVGSRGNSQMGFSLLSRVCNLDGYQTHGKGGLVDLRFAELVISRRKLSSKPVPCLMQPTRKRAARYGSHIIDTIMTTCSPGSPRNGQRSLVEGLPGYH